MKTSRRRPDMTLLGLAITLIDERLATLRRRRTELDGRAAALQKERRELLAEQAAALGRRQGGRDGKTYGTTGSREEEQTQSPEITTTAVLEGYQKAKQTRASRDR